MKKLARISPWVALAGLAALGTWSTVSHADPYRSTAEVYAGVNYNFVAIDDGWDRLNVETLSAKIGAQPHPFVGIEARFGFGAGEHRLDGVTYSLERTVGAYASLNLANASPVTPYFLLGASNIEIEATSIAGTTREEDSDFSFGAGVEIEMAPGLAGNIEYLNYYDNGTTIVDGVGLGFTFRF